MYYELPAKGGDRFSLITVVVAEPVTYVDDNGKTGKDTVWCLYNARWTPSASAPGGGHYEYRNCHGETVQVRY